MRMQPVNNCSFGARIKINKCQKMLKEVFDSKAMSGSSMYKVSTPEATGVTASNVSGPIFETVGSAFSAQQVGIDSFGIAPAVMEELVPQITADTAVSLQNSPSILGTTYSTLGSGLQKMGRTNIKNTNQNIPS